jgi:hypothetical protein
LTIQGPRFNKRALYGLISCCSYLNAAYKEAMAGSGANTTAAAATTAVSTGPIPEEHEKKVNHELLSWAQEKLGELVERENGVVGEQGPIATVESMLIVK